MKYCHRNINDLCTAEGKGQGKGLIDSFYCHRNINDSCTAAEISFQFYAFCFFVKITWCSWFHNIGNLLTR